jgi:hypothetical protein
VQQVSLHAPANVKIDGKGTEWGTMRAYNPSTEINYTMANDAKKLYLVVQVSDPDGKILAGLLANANKNLRESSKFIYTKGLLGSRDSVITIYNETGVQAMNTFEKNKIYTSELAIDLSLLGLDVAKAFKFSYHILVNGGTNKFVTKGFTSAKPVSAELEQQMQISNGISSATTDFWGEYTLAR